MIGTLCAFSFAFSFEGNMPSISGGFVRECVFDWHLCANPFEGILPSIGSGWNGIGRWVWREEGPGHAFETLSNQDSYQVKVSKQPANAPNSTYRKTTIL